VIALIAPQLDNSGQIHTPGGSALLGAGEQVSLDLNGDGLLSLSVERAALQAQIGHSGEIHAAGGLVQLSAQAAGALRASVVNSSGLIEASSLSQQGGRIVLDGGANGEVSLSGTLDAHSEASRGGRIDVKGAQLSLRDGAGLDASGATGGGQIHVGGGWQGQDAQHPNAQSLKADASVQALANASKTGDGGEVVFWSDGRTEFAGRIEVRGGAQGGNGGRAEVSGKQELAYSGRTDARAAKGRTGDLLLDPSTLEIRGGGSGSGSLSGSVVYEKDLEAQSANIVLEATNNITFKDLRATGSTDGVLDLADGVSFTAVAGRGGQMGSDPGDKIGVIRFEQKEDTLRVNGAAGILLIASNWNSGETDAVNGGRASVINVPHLVATGTGGNPSGSLRNYDLRSATPGAVDPGTITVFGANGITIGGSVNSQGGYVRLWADADSGTGGAFTLNAPISTAGGNVYLASGRGGITMNGRIDVGAGRLFFDRETGSYPGGVGPDGPKILAGQIHATGDIDVNTAFTFKGGASIFTDGTIRFGSVGVNLDTGTGVLTLRADKVDWGTATLNNLSTASLRLEPYDKATNMVLGDANGFASPATLNKLPGVKNLTIGREDGTGTISVPGNFSFSASGSFEMVNKTVDISAGTLSNTSGGITLTGDTINISQTVTANAGAGKVTLRQMTATNELHLGTGLSNATLGQISAATLEVGRSDGGNLVFDNDISTLASTVHLKSGQRVIGVNGGVSASRVAVSAGAGATLTDSRFDFSTLSLSVGGDTEVQQLGHAGWSLGSVDGLNGLTVKAGSSPTVQLQAQGRLGLNAPLALNNSSATLQLRSASGFDAEGAALSGQSRSTLEFSVSGAQSAVHIGGTGGQLSAASIAKLAGVDTLRLLASDDTVLAHAFSASVQNKVDIQAQRLTVDGALSTSSGSLHLSAAQGGLQLDTAVTAANTLSLNDQAGVGISGRGVLTAPKLAVRSSGSVQLKPGSSAHQVDEIAAEVGDLAFKSSRRLTVGSADGLNGVRASGSVDLRSSGASSDLVLNQAVVASNSAKVALPLLLEAGRHFINNAGSSAVQASDGAWSIYSTDPRQDVRGGLTPAFKQYDASSASTVLGQGNGMLYRVAPVLQAQLSGTVSKVYDGDTTATLNANQLQITTGAIDGDSVSLGSAQAVYDSKNVGNGKTVSVSHMNITASAQAGSVAVYGYRSQAVSADIGVITPRSLDASGLQVADKVYDGNSRAELLASSLSGMVEGDALSLSGSAAFADKNAGRNKAVAISGLALGGADAGNYLLSSDRASAQATITAKTISAGASSVAGKVYDGSTAATVTAGALQGVIGDDQVGLQANAQFADKNAGKDKAATVSLVLNGADASNYLLASSTQAATADIAAKVIAAGASTVAGKVYDGSTAASVTAGALQGLVDGDRVGLQASAQFADKNAGKDKAATIALTLNGADAGNYHLASSTQAAAADIAAKVIAADASTVAGKVYDGSTAASVTAGALHGLVDGDRVGLQASAQFADKNAGKDKAASVSLALSGADAGNYQLASSTQAAKADIAAKVISAGASIVAGKVYDGSTTANVTAGALQGLIAGDQVGLQAKAQFADKNAGKDKVATVSLALSGAGARNYQLVSSTQAATADIAAKTITADAATVAGKVYDGSTAASVTAGALQGLVGNDQVGLQASAQFADKSAGKDKAATVSLNLNGADAGNYQLSSSTQAAKADIAQRQLGAADLQAEGKRYDGSTQASLGALQLQGVLTGDQVQGQVLGQFLDAAVGSDKPVQISSVQLSGADAQNYSLSAASIQATGSISAPPASDATAATSITPPGGNSTRSGGQAGAGAGTGVGTGGAISPLGGDATNTAGSQLVEFKTGPGGATLSADAAGGSQGLGGAAASELKGGGSVARFDTEQALSAHGRVSIAVAQGPLEQPLAADVPLFSQHASAALEPLGQFKLTDLGDSLAVVRGSQQPSPLPEPQRSLRYSGEALLVLPGDQTSSLRLSFGEDGSLRVRTPAAAAELGHELLSAYALSALKRDAGIGVDQVRSVVLSYVE